MKKEDLENIIIAHRGIYDNDKVPENSIKSFEEAIKKNIPIELDIHLTKDNEIVVFHDDNLKRMTGIDKEIKDIKYSELKELKLLNTKEKIPLLKDVLKLVDGKVLIDIEIKDDKRLFKMLNLLIKILDNYKGDFIIKSFYIKYMFYLNIFKHNYIRGILIKKIENKFYNYFLNSNILIKIVSPHFLAYNKKIINSKIISKNKKRNIKTFIWTIKNEDEMNKYKNQNISYITEYVK